MCNKGKKKEEMTEREGEKIKKRRNARKQRKKGKKKDEEPEKRPALIKPSWRLRVSTNLIHNRDTNFLLRIS